MATFAAKVAESDVTKLGAGIRRAATELARHILSGERLDRATEGTLGADIKHLSPEARQAIRQSVMNFNREHGADRESAVMASLAQEFPGRGGFSILREQYLRDETGKIVKDKATGEARRVDFIVVKNRRVVRSLEVTSETASKAEQLAKEARIRKRGGHYVKDMATGEMFKIPTNLPTRVLRLE